MICRILAAMLFGMPISRSISGKRTMNAAAKKLYHGHPRMLMICSSVNLDLRIMGSPRPLVYERTLTIAAPFFREEVN